MSLELGSIQIKETVEENSSPPMKLSLEAGKRPQFSGSLCTQVMTGQILYFSNRTPMWKQKERSDPQVLNSSHISSANCPCWMKSTDLLKKENAKLKSDIASMSKRLENLKNYNRANNVEIHDIPEKQGENLIDTFSEVGGFMNCPVTNNKTVYSVDARNNNMKYIDVIIQMVSHLIRNIQFSQA
ncbi:hypothetical protein HHI36_011371 [Cryptolaemus montrouzieri]|uniref:Uncharacterized protein n=1 Tax=Cryptolaemus montrouzieri TaxID=559131 RepID=A0ABD2MMC6_9CUCU